MGSSNSVNVTIGLDKVSPIFYTGETVSGTVNVIIKEGEIKVDEVYILLNGETGYTTTRTVTNSNGSSHTETDYHTICFSTDKRTLDQPTPGLKEITYYPGQYSWRFDIQLPEHLPPSINEPRKYPHVRYYLKFVIDKPWYKRNKNEILYLTVFPRVNLSNNPQCFVSSIFGNHNRKDVNLKGTMDKLGYVSGETITGTLEIENPRKVSVKQIQLSLVQHSRIECNTHKETIFKLVLPTLSHMKQEQSVEKFALTIPQAYLAPSYDFTGGSHRTAHVHVDYILEFHVKVEGMFTNLDVNVPITIGTTTTTHENQEKLPNTFNLYPNFLSYYPETITDPK